MKKNKPKSPWHLWSTSRYNFEHQQPFIINKNVNNFNKIQIQQLQIFNNFDKFQQIKQ